MEQYIYLDGKWYKVGWIKTVELDDLFLAVGGNIARTASAEDVGKLRHALTPIDAPLAMKLGLAMIEWVKPGLRGRIVDFRPVRMGEHMVSVISGKEMVANHDNGQLLNIILSPPAPEPKTAEDALLEVEQALKDGLVTTERLLEIIAESK